VGGGILQVLTGGVVVLDRIGGAAQFPEKEYINNIFLAVWVVGIEPGPSKWTM
jgi:hypothetical protein